MTTTHNQDKTLDTPATLRIRGDVQPILREYTVEGLLVTVEQYLPYKRGKRDCQRVFSFSSTALAFDDPGEWVGQLTRLEAIELAKVAIHYPLFDM